MEAIPFEQLLDPQQLPDDSAEWPRLERHLGPWIRGRLTRLLARRGMAAGNDQLAELVQEVYCRLFERARRPSASRRPAGRPAAAAYFARLVDSVAIDRWRQRHAGKRRGELRLVTADDVEPTSELPSPEQELLAAEAAGELRRELAAALGLATRRHHLRALELALVEGWSSREIAARFPGGLSATAIDSLISRLRRRLARRGLTLPRRPRRS